MTGHKSIVSSLAVANGVLYSGSWDGTIRSWWLHDHSPLAVLGHEEPGILAPILSISIENNFLLSAHENGILKVSGVKALYFLSNLVEIYGVFIIILMQKHFQDINFTKH